MNGVQRGAQGQGVYMQPDRRRERRDTSRKIDLACILEAAVSIVAQFVPQSLGLGDYSPEASSRRERRSLSCLTSALKSCRMGSNVGI